MRVKILYYIIIVLIILNILDILLYWPTHGISYYYKQINTIEKVGKIQVTPGDLEELRKCKNIGESRENECVRKFYENYTLLHGVNNSFSHLALLQRKDPSFIQDCHYISHGIGHAELRLNHGNAQKSFAIMSENSYYKNLATCGNGYFHGVIEEYVKYTTDTKKIIQMMSSVCPKVDSNFAIDCYHGVGHAVYIQKDYNENEALAICDQVANFPETKFACYTGVFMEMVGDMPDEKMVEKVNGKIKFTECDQVGDTYRTACYDQLPSIYERNAKNPRDFVHNISYCKEIPDPLYRLHCVKLFAGRAERIVQEKNISDMCANTSNSKERIFCTAVFARRIGKSLDINGESKIYHDAVRDVCKTLPFYYVSSCVDMVDNHKQDLYLPSDEYVL